MKRKRKGKKYNKKLKILDKVYAWSPEDGKSLGQKEKKKRKTIKFRTRYTCSHW